MKKLPDHLSRECIIAAIRAYDAGVAHQFKSARLYEIEFEGRRYPSKAIVGLAATLATGTEFTPADFSGGIKSKCVRLLLDQGFTIASQGAGDDEVALFPDEGQTTMEFVEGAAMQVVVNRYERDRQARQAALRLHGCRCQVCGLDMASRYGEIGQGFTEIPVQLDAAVLSDDYVLQSYGGFFTGAFVGLAAVDYAGYGTQAEFYQFEYQELGDRLAADGSYSWEAGETRDK